MRPAGRSQRQEQRRRSSELRSEQTEVTYNHHPLYTFVKDVKKGQTNGEALDVFGAKWYALSPAGAKVEQNEAMSSGYPAAGGYGYGY